MIWRRPDIGPCGLHQDVHRLKPVLEPRLSDEQYEFRTGRSTHEALLAFELLISKSIEWNAPIWFISVDLRKAFDRIEHASLFQALLSIGLDSHYVGLLANLYSDQRGVLGNGSTFRITRGVRQGDVLSALLFNVALDAALDKWRSKLNGHGLRLSDDVSIPKLTNVRYADDLLLFSPTLSTGVEMLELLMEALADYGLEINTKKTKIFSTCPSLEGVNWSFLVECRPGFVEVVGRGDVHTYLGRSFSGNLKLRAQAALEH